MINLAMNPTMTLGNKEEKIKEFAVWWRTPFGLTASLMEAVEHCEANNLDPQLMIAPIPVAIDVTGRYEEMK